MQQVLFHLPILQSQFGPDGIPIQGFGVMLFITFIVGIWFLGWRSRVTKANLPKERIQDFVIIVFVAGLIGARITYMIQYKVEIKDFYKIWEGGIVLYGGIIAGVLAFIIFYYGTLKRKGVSFWKLADACAPGLALCIALGRMGCFLNGCCYGHVAPDDCPSVGFPMLTAPAKETLMGSTDAQGKRKDNAYQTTLGFTVTRNSYEPSVVVLIEPKSNAQRAGLRPGDIITKINGIVNGQRLIVTADPSAIEKFERALGDTGLGRIDTDQQSKNLKRLVFTADNPDDYKKATKAIESLRREVLFINETDVFQDQFQTTTARGSSHLILEVSRDGQTETIAFTPRTLGLHPTQLYEVISMVLLCLFLLAYYPHRRHDGQTFNLFLIGYGLHRILNEKLRNDTDIVALGMTISQLISCGMFVFAFVLELIQRKFNVNLKTAPKPDETAKVG